MNGPTEVQCRVLYKKIVDHMAEADKLILELIRHPDVTSEQLIEAAKGQHEKHMQHRTLRDQLRRKYPSFRNPWNDK